MSRLRQALSPLLGASTEKSCHKITGPLNGEGGVKKQKGNSSLLANAFQNAWKQGSFAAEVSI